MVFQVALYDDLYVAIICFWSDAVMHSGQPESDIIDAEEAPTRIFTVDQLDHCSFLRVASAVYNEEIPFPEDEFIKGKKSPLIV